MTCKACNVEVTSKYCPNCGQPSQLKRIDSHYLIHEVGHVLHFEKGILHTIKQLLIRPGETVHKFITEDRSRLVKPVIFIIVTSLVFSIVSHLFHVDSFILYNNYQNTTTADKIFQWGDAHSGYINIFIAVFIAIWLKLFFRKKPFNLFEILILLCFITGMAMLIFSVFAISQGLSHFKLMATGGVVGMIYCTWAIGAFFGKQFFFNYVKAFFAYILGMITFSLLVILSGNLIDIFLGN